MGFSGPQKNKVENKKELEWMDEIRGFEVVTPRTGRLILGVVVII
jgi:hypothetical protein